ncbi:MAG: ABC transporter permease [Christensenellaceae bacterium]|jgi:ribose transport system permease protein
MNNKSIIKKNGFVKYITDNLGKLIALAVLCVIFSIASEQFLKEKNLINILRQISINAIIAFGMTAVLLIGGIDLSVGSVAALCGCTAVVIISAGMPVFVGVLGAVLLGCLVGLANGLIISKSKLPPFIVTLGMMTIARGFAYIYSDGRPTPIKNEWFDQIGNAYVFNIIPTPVVIMVVVLIFMSVLLNKTRFGRNIYAIGGNTECALFSGIRVERTQIGVYMINGSLTAIAGLILTSRLGSGQPMVGEGYELDAIAAAILGGTSFSGGIGRIGGTIIGALILGVLSNGLNLLQVSYYWQLVAKGAIIIVAVYVDHIKKINKSTMKAVQKESA